MTTQSALLLAGIVFAFAIFGGVLAWADFYTRGRKPAAEASPAEEGRYQHQHEEQRAA